MKVIKISMGLFILLTTFFTSFSSAQVNLYQRSLLEIKAGFGGSVFLGDLGGGRGKGKDGFVDVDLSSIRQNFSVGVKLNLSNRISLRGDVFKARLYGDDALSGDAQRMNRNLSFRSDLTEISVTAELVSFNLAKRGNSKTNTSEIYSFAGFGWIHYNPQAKLNGVWYDLQPLGTEGQGVVDGKKPYNLNSIVIPFGIGYRKNVAKSTYVGIELSLRKSFTDYIDDVSGTYANNDVIRENNGNIASELSDRRLNKEFEASGLRGNPSENDNYSFVQLTLSQGFGKAAAKQHMNIFKQQKANMLSSKCPSFK
jgi:Domain of unknown function (DUF6089)